MSVRLPKLVVGKAEPDPVLSFHLDEGVDHVALIAKHSEDTHAQTLLELRYHPTTGVLQCFTRDIHMPRLAEVLNVQLCDGIRCVFENKSGPLPPRISEMVKL